MSKYLSRKFLATVAVFVVGLTTVVTDTSVSEVEMVDAVGRWLALLAPIVFTVMEAMVDRMGTVMTAQQQVVKYQVEKMEMAKELAKVQSELTGEVVGISTDQLANVIAHPGGGYV